MQGPDASGWWRGELGSFLQFGMFLLLLTAMLLWPGEKAPVFVVAVLFSVAIMTCFLAWGMYRSYRSARSREGKPPEGPRTTE